jgi:fructose-1,6-bisphosphatase/sedoheptulose 1,7-bisphosphatase-like protein
VVLCWVDGVDADGVGVEVLQDGDVALARCLVGEGVLVAAVGAGGAVGGVVLFFC